ncbi:MAG TPA: molybdopterin converting factor subunit 1 [Thermomicrobiales bacterium]|nr:molybdopterin converting factor subunit 1 [Thermomicrobiales bacterium]
MNITIRYFAIMREHLGKSVEEIDVADGTTAGEIFGIAIRDTPRLASLERAVMVMVNEEYVDPDHILQPGDEVALIPPVSGGDHLPSLFTVTGDELDPRAVEALVAGPDAGALVTFAGTVRDNARGLTVTALDYEAYPSAAEKMLARVGAEVADRWPEVRIAISHRTGHLVPGEASVVIVTASPHRENAYAANAWAITRIKEIVPIWKKEWYEDGSSWIGSELDYQIETGRIDPKDVIEE